MTPTAQLTVTGNAVNLVPSVRSFIEELTPHSSVCRSNECPVGLHVGGREVVKTNRELFFLRKADKVTGPGFCER
jgi:hypothetical protein